VPIEQQAVKHEAGLDWVLGGGMLTSAVAATTLTRAPLFDVPGRLRRAAAAVGELLALVGIILSIPFVIVTIGVPIALCVRLLLWIGGAL
jgi:hypothetical protein